ncbi:glycosyltransferase family 2 protein [Methylomonas methanica]|uniref:Glycosyl transferase family 2 n=1 Tax=Methylomonas methanica (strain DSM 25384 / MC09) TaxID=857087 RepID=G0A245_METMM|nr:glycosyltransferase family 2 protein [Methylomonas methanica]AEG02588.1 glycosyl transferase family 2 [Methylomonas methanica MC09]
MEYRLLIVILNYIATEVTLDCLQSLSNCPAVTGGEARVVVWENGTGEQAVATLERAIALNHWEAWAELLISPVNLGFTGGNNRVIERAMLAGDRPEYFLLLNSDTLVTDDSLISLLAFMDNHPQAGIAGSRLLTVNGEHQCSPFRFPGIASEFDRGLKLGVVSRLLSNRAAAMPPPSHETQVDWVSGASMMLRRKMLEQIGLLDEGFFTYFEDVDLCRRAHRSGWGVWYVPASQVIHLEGASSGISSHIAKRRPSFWFAARRRYFLKHHGKWTASLVDALFLVAFATWRLRRRIQRKPETDPVCMLGDFMRNSVFAKGYRLPVVVAPHVKPD